MDNSMHPTTFLFLSPHFDDVVLSCGGIIRALTLQRHKVVVWTVCGGEPEDNNFSHFAQELHARWGDEEQPVHTRIAEDLRANQVLGADTGRFLIPDCIYRRHPETQQALYDSEEAIFSKLSAAEDQLVASVGIEIAKVAKSFADDAELVLVAPLGVGGHVDHNFTRKAAEQSGLPLWYYIEYPYVTNSEIDLEVLIPPNYHPQDYPIGVTGLQAWQTAIGAHQSQISTFWGGLTEMETAIAAYHAQPMSSVLLKPDFTLK